MFTLLPGVTSSRTCLTCALLFLFLFAEKELFAQEWVHSFTPGNSLSEEVAGAAWTAGGVVIAGSQFDPAEGWDAFLFMLDATGDTLWTQAVKGPDDEKSAAVACASGSIFLAINVLTKDGGEIVRLLRFDALGRSTGSGAIANGDDGFRCIAMQIVGGGLSLALNKIDSTGRSRARIAHYDFSFARRWEAEFADAPSSRVNALSVGPGTVAVVGECTRNSRDVFFLLCDSAGNKLSSRVFDWEDEAFVGLASDAAGSMFGLGWTGAQGNTRPLVMKFNSVGAYQWTFVPAETAEGSNRALAAVAGGDGAVTAVGRQWNGASFNIRTIRIAQSGSMQWERLYAGTGLAADNEAPFFAGVSAAQRDETSMRFVWHQARDNQSMSDEIVYEVYISSISGGQDFDRADYTVTGTERITVTPFAKDQDVYVVVRARDAEGNTEKNMRELLVRRIPDPIAVFPATLPMGIQGKPYTVQLVATGGVPPFVWEVANSIPPPGLTLQSDGVLSGVPSQSGVYPFTVRVRDSWGDTALKQWDFICAPDTTVFIVTSILPDAAIGINYYFPLQAANGLPPYIWSLIGGTLPAGLTLSEAGEIVGMAMEEGAFNFDVRVIDARPDTVMKSLRLQVVKPPSLIFERDTTLESLSGTYTTFAVRSGATVRVVGDTRIRCIDSAAIDGVLISDCNDIRLAAGSIRISGSVMNRCSDTSVQQKGNILLVPLRSLELDSQTDSAAFIATSGELVIAEDSLVALHDLIVHPRVRSALPLPPVGSIMPSRTRGILLPGNRCPVEFSLRGIDPDGGSISFTVDYGDGTMPENVSPEEGSYARLVHEYTASGEFPVSLTILDDDGDAANVQCRVIVDDAPHVNSPLRAIGLGIEPAVIAVEVGDTVPFFARFGMDIGKTPVTWTWDFGDGSGSGAEYAYHSFAASGRYAVNLVVMDDSGYSASADAVVYAYSVDTSADRIPPSFQHSESTWFIGKAALLAARHILWTDNDVSVNADASVVIDETGLSAGASGGSILWSSFGNIAINGTGSGPVFQAGRGGDGALSSIDTVSVSGTGGPGGRVALSADTLLIMGGMYKGGNGGNGGGATAMSIKGPAYGIGGNGGEAYNTVKLDGWKSAEIAAQAIIRCGAGGDGGESVAQGAEGITACPQGGGGFNAWSRAGQGGNAASVAAVRFIAIGADLLTVQGGQGGRGGTAASTGGRGANAFCQNNALGGRGGDAWGVGGTGGESAWFGKAALLEPDACQGGEGGNAHISGGEGGMGDAVPNPPNGKQGCPGDTGVSTLAVGGNGGTAFGSNGARGRSRVFGMERSGAPGAVVVSGGKGGDANALGGAGGIGDSCCAGGLGGRADAQGGSKGVPRAFLTDSGGIIDTSGRRDGNATALGGVGGRGGDCCGTLNPGGKGGEGGASYTEVGTDATLESKAGGGGRGGNGKPPGIGGAPGTAGGVGNGPLIDGAPGTTGTLCVATFDFYLSFKSLAPDQPVAPGVYTLEVFNGQTDVSANKIGTVDVSFVGTIYNAGTHLVFDSASSLTIFGKSFRYLPTNGTWPTWYPHRVTAVVVWQDGPGSGKAILTGKLDAMVVSTKTATNAGGIGAPEDLAIFAGITLDAAFDVIVLEFNDRYNMPRVGTKIQWVDP